MKRLPSPVPSDLSIMAVEKKKNEEREHQKTILRQRAPLSPPLTWKEKEARARRRAPCVPVCENVRGDRKQVRWR